MLELFKKSPGKATDDEKTAMRCFHDICLMALKRTWKEGSRLGRGGTPKRVIRPTLKSFEPGEMALALIFPRFWGLTPIQAKKAAAMDAPDAEILVLDEWENGNTEGNSSKNRKICFGKSKERMESYFELYRQQLRPIMKGNVDDDNLLASMEAWDNKMADYGETLKRKGMTADVGINDYVVGKKKKLQLELTQSDQDLITLEFGVSMEDVEQYEEI